MDYPSQYHDSLQHSGSFWLQQAQNIDWYKSPSIGLRHDVDNSYSWFDDGQLNTCFLPLIVT